MLHFGEERECNLTGIDVSHLEVSHGVNKCSLSATDTLYRDFLMIGFNIFIGQLVLLCVIEKFGRRIPISEYILVVKFCLKRYKYST